MDQKSGLFVPEEENLREKGEWGQYTLWQQGGHPRMIWSGPGSPASSSSLTGVLGCCWGRCQAAPVDEPLSLFGFFHLGKKLATSCQSVPKTCSLLEKFPDATGCKRGQVGGLGPFPGGFSPVLQAEAVSGSFQIKFSVMQPGTHVWPHTGPTNCRLRMHLGLVIPKHGCRIRCTDQTR